MLHAIYWPAEQILSRYSANTHKHIATVALLIAVILSMASSFKLLPAPYLNLVPLLLLVFVYVLTASLSLYARALADTEKLVTSLSSQQLDARLGLGPQQTFHPLAMLVNTLGRQYQRLHQFVRTSAGEAQFTATELEGTSSQMANNAEEQHQRLSSAAAGAEQITATLREITQHIQKTAELSLTSYKSSETGKQQAGSAIHEIRQVVEHVNTTEARLRHLKERSDEITTATASIEAISQQINLLALNASIEAARAGEAGRGFAVVADEIRNLAMRTREATGDIGTLLEEVSGETEEAFASIIDSQTRVQRAQEQVETTGEALDNIQNSTNQTRDGIQTVSVNIREHLQVSEDMAKTLEIIAELANETRKGTEKTQDMVHYLNELSRRLNSHVPEIRS